MPSFWVDDEGTYYSEQSATTMISEDGKYLLEVGGCWVDDDGTYYYQQSSTELISEDGLYLLRITPPVPQVGNPIGAGALIFWTYPA